MNMVLPSSLAFIHNLLKFMKLKSPHLRMKMDLLKFNSLNPVDIKALLW